MFFWSMMGCFVQVVLGADIPRLMEALPRVTNPSHTAAESERTGPLVYDTVKAGGDVTLSGGKGVVRWAIDARLGRFIAVCSCRYSVAVS